MRFWFYLIRASWRNTRGRWYVWRDAPTDIVRKVAALWYVARKENEDVSVIREARKEYKLRKARGEQQ